MGVCKRDTSSVSVLLVGECNDSSVSESTEPVKHAQLDNGIDFRAAARAGL